MKRICDKCNKEFCDNGRKLSINWCFTCQNTFKDEYEKLKKELADRRVAERRQWKLDHPEEYKKKLAERKQKSEATKIAKYGSLEAAERARMENQQKTLQDKYGEGITNPSQLEFVRKKISNSHLNMSNEEKSAIAEKAKATRIENYGSVEESYKQVFKKQSQTLMEKYGVEHVWEIEGLQEKKKQTLQKKLEEDPDYYEKRFQKSVKTKIEKYGSLEEAYRITAEHQKETFLERYNVDNASKVNVEKRIASFKAHIDNPEEREAIRQKKIKTFAEHYGSLEAANNQKTLKAKATNLEKYGCETPLQNEKIKEKIKKSKLDRYGDEYYNNKKQAKAIILKKYGSYKDIKTSEEKAARKRQFIDENMVKYRTLDFSLRDMEYFEKDNLPYVRCLHCNKEFRLTLAPSLIMTNLHCPECHPFESSSGTEKIIRNKIAEFYNGPSEYGSRKLLDGKELDMYFPELNLAIEYDGSFWHRYSEDLARGGVEKSYHKLKTDLCEEQGIHLIHIFDEEFINKPGLTFNMLQRFFNKIPRKIGARKCSIVEVESKVYREFLDDNHLQGYAPAKIKLGLECDGELLAVMSFSKPRFNKQFEWELIRYCEKIDVAVMGGKSKLLKYFEKTYNPSSIISYCDRRWFTGSSYEKLGFKLQNISSPNYKYFKPGYPEFYSRINFQKHKLKDIDGFVFNENLTETENMRANGYYAIYDSGNKVFVKYGKSKIN